MKYSMQLAIGKRLPDSTVQNPSYQTLELSQVSLKDFVACHKDPCRQSRTAHFLSAIFWATVLPIPTDSVPSKRVLAIQAFRGLAAMLVVLLHLHNIEAKYYPSHFLAPLQYGWIGVDLFFVTSGVVISPALCRAAARTSRPGVAVGAGCVDQRRAPGQLGLAEERLLGTAALLRPLRFPAAAGRMLMEKQNQLRIGKMFYALGDWSYSIYLSHEIVCELMARIMNHITPRGSFAILVVVAIALPAVILVGYLDRQS